METALGIEIVVRGRNVEVPDHYRQHVADRLAKVERWDQKIIRIDVELSHERNPRQSERAQRVEMTCRTRGPVVRAEARAEDFYKALELAAERLERRLSSAATRRLSRRKSASIAAVAANGLTDKFAVAPDAVGAADESEGATGAAASDEIDEIEDGPGRVVRVKDHPAQPMTVDQALLEMELVGHDFYLFADVDSGRPSVVYRRHAYDYGLIRLTE